jgi:hypothetical protein
MPGELQRIVMGGGGLTLVLVGYSSNSSGRWSSPLPSSTVYHCSIGVGSTASLLLFDVAEGSMGT